MERIRPTWLSLISQKLQKDNNQVYEKYTEKPAALVYTNHLIFPFMSTYMYFISITCASCEVIYYCAN